MRRLTGAIRPWPAGCRERSLAGESPPFGLPSLSRSSPQPLGIFIWYDEDAIPALEPRRKEKAERINAAGYMTINEKRRAVGLDEVEGGDVLFVPSTSIPLELAGQVDLPETGSDADPDKKPDEDEAEDEDE